MPTGAEFQALGDAVTTAWTTNYESTGVSGLVLTDKTDSTKKLFIPAAGCCINGSFDGVGKFCACWSKDIGTNAKSYALELGYSYELSLLNWNANGVRLSGISIRPVVG